MGKGHVGGTVYGEFPTVDLLANKSGGDLKDDVPQAPLPTMTFQGALGLTDSLDLEVGVDGVLYIVLPLPLGVSGGLRYQLSKSEAIALALAGRVGVVGFGASGDSDSSSRDDSVSAFYSDVSLATQLNPTGSVRPGLALSLIPAAVHNSANTDTPENFAANMFGVTVSLTFVFNKFQIGPFANFVYFSSDPIGQAWVPSAGFLVAIRPNDHQPPAEPPVRLDVPPPPSTGPPGGPPGAY